MLIVDMYGVVRWSGMNSGQGPNYEFANAINNYIGNTLLGTYNLYSGSTYGSVYTYFGTGYNGNIWVSPNTTSRQYLGGTNTSYITFSTLSTGDLSDFPLSNLTGTYAPQIYKSMNTPTSAAQGLYFVSVQNVNQPAICGWNSSGAAPILNVNKILTSIDRPYLSWYYYYLISGAAYAIIHQFFYNGGQVSYVGSNGAYNQVSDDTLKCNLRKKNPYDLSKQYLNRILNTEVYSYSYDYDDCHRHSVNVGILRSQVKQNMNNGCLGSRKRTDNAENYNCGKDECLLCNASSDDKTVNYTELSCYHILAFQAYVKQTDDKIADLETKNTDLQYQINLLQNQLNSANQTITGLQSVNSSYSQRLNLIEDKLSRLMG